MGKAVSRCVILSAGPVTDPSVLNTMLLSDDYIIAADGGLRLAQQLGVIPDKVVADFDSCKQPNVPKDVDLITLPVRKDVTDTAAAVQEGVDAGFRDFLILGGTGGRLDHQYANTQLLVSLAKQGCRAVLADERNHIEAVVSSPVTVAPCADRALSLFAFGGSVRGLSIHGASYELSGYELQPDDPLCVSNHTTDAPCEISFSEGTLLLFLSKD